MSGDDSAFQGIAETAARVQRREVSPVELTQLYLGRIEKHTLALALRATTPEVAANVFDNLSKRAGDMVSEDRDLVGPVQVSHVIAAQGEILAVARRLADDGVIQSPRVVSERMV